MSQLSSVNRNDRSPDLDLYPTPAWATRALLEETEIGRSIRGKRIWEPAAGLGSMARPLAEYGNQVRQTDISGSASDGIVDFLDQSCSAGSADWIITNPPYSYAVDFALRAAELEVPTAMLLRWQFLESRKRHKLVFKPHPPSHVYQFAERVQFNRDRVAKQGQVAVAYVWVVWDRQPTRHTTLDWIGECRRRLERDSDYI